MAHTQLLAATNPAAVGEIFNICAEAVTANYFVETIADNMGVEAQIITVRDVLVAQLRGPLPFNRLQKLRHAVLSCDKARRVLGFESRHNFEAGHQHTYAWFLQQGLERTVQPLNDPTWNISRDSERQAQLIETPSAAAGV